MSTRRRRLLSVLGLLLAAWWLSGFVVVRSLSRRLHPQHPEPLPSNPRIHLREHRLTTPAGESFGAWWYPGETARAAILLLHANGGSRTAMKQRATQLQRRGHGVLVPTLHAHGDATGTLNDYGYTARHQVPVCLDLIEELAPGGPVVVEGLSLGAATAIFAAAEVADRVAGYVLESPYRDLPTAARNRLEQRLPAPLDRIAHLAMMAAAPVFFDPYEISPLRALEGMPRELPALFLVGSEDDRAPPEQVRDLARAHGQLARFVVIPGGGHGNLVWADPELYWGTLEAFLNTVEVEAAAGARELPVHEDIGRD